MPTKTKKTTSTTSRKKTATKATKKTVKKTAKKSAKKTTMKGQPTVRALVCASGEECFWTTDGQVLENLDELALAFGSMEDEVFLHHVTKEKNDFADWVEQVLEDTLCAADLRKVRKPKSARTVVVRHLKTYNR